MVLDRLLLCTCHFKHHAFVKQTRLTFDVMPGKVIVNLEINQGSDRFFRYSGSTPAHWIVSAVYSNGDYEVRSAAGQ